MYQVYHCFMQINVSYKRAKVLDFVAGVNYMILMISMIRMNCNLMCLLSDEHCKAFRPIISAKSLQKTDEETEM